MATHHNLGSCVVDSRYYYRCYKEIQMSGLKEQRDVWRKRFEEGSDYPVLLETYKANRDKETWRSVIMVESLCEYATLLEEKVDKMYNRDTTECDILDEFGRVDTELAQLDSQIEFLEEERGRLLMHHDRLSSLIDDINYFKGLNRV